MVKKSEVQSQIDALTKELESAEDDEPAEEIWVRNKDGHETKLTGKRATAWLKKHGYEAEETTENSESGEGEGGTEQDGTPPPGHRYFKPRAKG